MDPAYWLTLPVDSNTWLLLILTIKRALTTINILRLLVHCLSLSGYSFSVFWAGNSFSVHPLSIGLSARVVGDGGWWDRKVVMSVNQSDQSLCISRNQTRPHSEQSICNTGFYRKIKSRKKTEATATKLSWAIYHRCKTQNMYHFVEEARPYMWHLNPNIYIRQGQECGWFLIQSSKWTIKEAWPWR